MNKILELSPGQIRPSIIDYTMTMVKKNAAQIAEYSCQIDCFAIVNRSYQTENFIDEETEANEKIQNALLIEVRKSHG